MLPTLTEVSRASLLCGELRTGGQDAERPGTTTLARAHGLPGAALFHKKPLDSSRLGYAVADDVAAAIADVTGHPLVTCVLNTIDDALDRSDPGGTEWGTDAVKHLAPLLDRARHAGRIVVLTADHGHIVERRQGTQRAYAAISSGRSRAAVEPAGDGEVLVTGRRVLRHDGRAVLAVDEHLRYGPLKAGYHGGAAPAEAVVPVIVLVPARGPRRRRPAAGAAAGAGLVDRPRRPPPRRLARRPSARRRPRPPRPAADFRRRPAGRPRPPCSTSRIQSPRSRLAGRLAPGSHGRPAVLKSAAYAAQKKIAGPRLGHRRSGPRAARRAPGRPGPPAGPGAGRDRAGGLAGHAARGRPACPAAAERRGLPGAARRRGRGHASSWTRRCCASSSGSARERAGLPAAPARGHRRAAPGHRPGQRS